MRLSRRDFIGLAGAFGLAGCAGKALDVAPVIGGRLTFAAINDLHVLDSRSTAIVNRAVQQINAASGVRFTVVLGDLATDGAFQELTLAKTSLDRLKQPCFAVPGNHDVYMKSKNIYGNYQSAFGDMNWDNEQEGWVFLGLDSCEGPASDVTVRVGQMDWLRWQLDRINKRRPIALFAHHPFNPNTKSYRVKNAGEVVGLFREHNLKLVACGHYHGNQVETAGGVLFTTTACCSTTRDNFDGTKAKGYRLFHLTRDTVETEFVEVPTYERAAREDTEKAREAMLA